MHITDYCYGATAAAAAISTMQFYVNAVVSFDMTVVDQTE